MNDYQLPNRKMSREKEIEKYGKRIVIDGMVIYVDEE